MKIIELQSLSSENIEDLLGLMKELDPEKTVTAEMLQAAVAGAHVFAAEESGRILGCATFCVTEHPLGRKGWIEDVVVSSACRGRGLGRQLVEHIIEYARGLAPIELCLTSRPAREAANKLYKAVGFNPYQTNVYKLKLI
ncbi:MAG: GNAT family N-acetyltransferase [Bacteroidales bacterium]|nr:GNAT family N-acetyltransferase [Bacteroidales bacterium]